MKKCTQCKKILPPSEFHFTLRKYKSTRLTTLITYHYRHAKCKNCRNANQREYRKRTNYNGKYYHRKILSKQTGVGNERSNGSDTRAFTKGGMVR